MKKWIIIAAVVLVFIGGLVAALMLSPRPETQKQSTAETSAVTAEEPAVASDLPLYVGRYELYTTEAVSATGYDKTVLFFHASWCPECRAFEQAINDSTIPAGVQILKVDYDTSVDLRQEYGVTLQSTFVSVSDDGAEVSKWVGYGKDKSVEAILENL